MSRHSEAQTGTNGGLQPKPQPPATGLVRYEVQIVDDVKGQRLYTEDMPSLTGTHYLVADVEALLGEMRLRARKMIPVGDHGPEFLWGYDQAQRDMLAMLDRLAGKKE